MAPATFFTGAFARLVSRFRTLLPHPSEPASTRRLSHREQYLLWAAVRANGEIFTFTGVDNVPGGCIIKIGLYSSESLRTRSEVSEDFTALQNLETLGLIKRVSKSKLIATNRGRTVIAEYYH